MKCQGWNIETGGDGVANLSVMGLDVDTLAEILDMLEVNNKVISQPKSYPPFTLQIIQENND